jgi:hypothetical protein
MNCRKNQPGTAFSIRAGSDANIAPQETSPGLWPGPTAHLGGWLLWLATIWLFGAVCDAGTLAYNDFSSPAGLILQAYAAPFEGRLRLTQAITGRGIGGAWLDTKQPVKDGFETTFQIQITDKYVHGADGLAFAVQNAPTPRLGWPGCNIGFGGLTNLLVVKFDNYHGETLEHVAYDEVAVLAASSPTTILWDGVATPIASVTNGVVFSDGRVHTVRIVYVPGNLQVYLDDLENPLMTVYVNLARVMDLDEGRAWVGFTAACGADWQNQDLVSWSFASDNNATLPGRLMTHLNSGNNPGTNAATPLFSAPGVPAPETTPLVRDRAFGYALPWGMGPGFQIEASTDLVHWTTLTNAAFYFKDLDSTNYNARFYRFFRK